MALVFKGAYLASFARNNPFFGFIVADAAIYADWARAINAGGWLGEDVFYRAPLYPYFLSVVFRVLGPGTLGVCVLQLVMGLGVLALIHRAAARVYGERAGLLAAIFGLGYAPFTFEETKLLPTVTEVLLGLVSLCFLLEAERTSKLRHWVAGSLALGLAIICRPNYALVVPILMLMIGIRFRRSRRPIVPPVLALGLLPALVVGVVAARNYAVGRDVVLISSNGGVTFAQGNNPRARGAMAVLAGFSGAVEDQQREERALAERAMGRPLKPSEVSRFWYRQGFRFIREQPRRYLGLLVDKLALIVSNREFGSNYLLEIDTTLSPVLRLASIPFGLVLGFAMIGLCRILHGRLPASALVATFFGAVVMMLLFFVNTRYRMTLAPAAAVMAGGGMDELLRRIRHPRRAWAILGAVAGVLVLSLPPWLPFDEAEILRGDADYWANLGVAFRRTKQLDRALWAYDRAIAMSPRVHRHYLGKTEVLIESGADEATLARWREHVADKFRGQREGR